MGIWGPLRSGIFVDKPPALLTKSVFYSQTLSEIQIYNHWYIARNGICWYTNSHFYIAKIKYTLSVCWGVEIQLGNTVNTKIVKLEKRFHWAKEICHCFLPRRNDTIVRIVFVLPKGRIQSSGLILFPPGLLFSKSEVKWHIINTFYLLYRS